MINFFVFFLIAFLYSSVGLGGGTAYTAFLAVFGFDKRYIPSSALFLNMLVTLISFRNFRIHINLRKKIKFLLFLYVLGAFGAFVGANIKLSESSFYITLGFFLVLSSLFSIFTMWVKNFGNLRLKDPYIPPLSFFIGILAGITGIGGGVYLAPLLLLSKFDAKEIASITSLYIFINSSIGFTAHAIIKGNFSHSVLPFAIFVISGALLGSYLGSRKFKSETVKLILNLIILTIGGKLLWRGVTLT